MAKRVARAKGIKCPAKPAQGPPEVVSMPTPMQAEDAARLTVASEILRVGLAEAKAMGKDGDAILSAVADLRVKRAERDAALQQYIAATNQAMYARDRLMVVIDGEQNIAKAPE